MGSRRRYAIPLVLLLAAACGDAGPQSEGVLSAATESASQEAPVTSTSTSISTTTTAAPATTTTRPAPATTPTTTPRRTQTTRVPVTPAPPLARYSPTPPPPGVEPDGYGGYGGVTTASANGLTLELHVYAREQYRGSPTQVWVEVAHPVGVAVTAITIDFGNGHVVNATPLPRWSCGSADDAPASAVYTYPVPGRFRVTATANALPCMAMPAAPGGWGPAGAGPWGPATPPQAVSAGMDVLQRADAPPPPVGPPPGA